MASKSQYTVWHAFYDILRHYGLTTIFGNPGSTEEPMLANFPKDFKYILALQEASVVGMADGYAQATRKPVVVSLHTAAGTGNGMGNIMTAALNKTPMVIIAGQQTRQMLIGDPYLTNRNGTQLPQPWVKWAYQPVRAQDVPAAVIRAIVTASLPPAGPVYLSIPLDDWGQAAAGPISPRHVAPRFGPDPDALQNFAERMILAKKLALVLGPEVDRAKDGWQSAIRLAEHLGAAVYQSPFAERAVFPERHVQFAGQLAIARGALSKQVAEFDLLLIVGAEVWRQYAWIAGPILPDGCSLIQITEDPHDAAAALVGDSLLSDVGLALDGLYELLKTHEFPKLPKISHKGLIQGSVPREGQESCPMTASEVFTALAELRPAQALLLQESPSNAPDLARAWPIHESGTYFTFASGGLGWNAPAAAGVALAQRHLGSKVPTILVIGDGSINYSIQSIYSAVQHQLKLIYVVIRNEEYAVLKEFAVLEKTPNVPALDLPGLDAIQVAKGYGCPGALVSTRARLQEAFSKALNVDGPFMIECLVDKAIGSLAPSA